MKKDEILNLVKEYYKENFADKTQEPVVFIEVQHGSYFGEDDIVRIEDDYNRK